MSFEKGLEADIDICIWGNISLKVIFSSQLPPTADPFPPITGSSPSLKLTNGTAAPSIPRTGAVSQIKVSDLSCLAEQQSFNSVSSSVKENIFTVQEGEAALMNMLMPAMGRMTGSNETGITCRYGQNFTDLEQKIII